LPAGESFEAGSYVFVPFHEDGIYREVGIETGDVAVSDGMSRFVGAKADRNAGNFSTCTSDL